MGKKNKYKKDNSAPDDKSPESKPPQQASQQSRNPQQNQQQQTPAQKSTLSGSQQQTGQQKNANVSGEKQTQRGAGGDSRGQQTSQQGGWAEVRNQPPSQRPKGASQQQQASQQGDQKQQGAWGGGQKQQGTWGGGQNQSQSERGAGGDSQRQQASQQGTSRGDRNQPQSQRAAGGDNYGQQASQQGAWGGRQNQQSQQANRGDSQQKQPSQQGSWVGGQRQQQSQRGVGGDGNRQQGAGTGGQRQQQYQQGGGNQRNQQQQNQNIPQKMSQLSMSTESPIPTKSTSCNGIVRGTLGKPGVVEVNYLKLNLNNMPSEAYHYDVTIDPDRPKKFLRTVFEQCGRQMFPNIEAAFDGMKSCYTFQRLPTPISCKIEIPDSGNRVKEFKVDIKETDTFVVDMNSLRTYQNERVFDKPMRALQVLEVVLASNNHKLGIRAGRSFFRKPDRPYDLQDGFEAWTGLYQAAILGEEPLLNVDIAHKSFPSETTLIKYLSNQRIDLNQQLDNRQYSNIKAFLKDMNIVYTPPASFGSVPRTYKVIDIGTPASSTKFKTDDGKEQTVANYYKSRGYALQHPELNCIKVGSSIKSISLPMELCFIPGGQALNRKDKERQVSNMIRFAATSTNVRKSKIMDLLNYFNHNANDTIRKFGLTIGQNFIKVPMRLLPQPFMEYFQGKTVTTFKGAWRMDGMKFLATSKPSDGHKWAILYETGKCRRDLYHNLEEFKKTVLSTSVSLNMGLQNNAEIRGFTFRDIQAVFRELSAKKFDLVFVVLSDFGTPYYKIKQTAELEIGILTQCIKENTLLRKLRDMTVFSNILLKVNGKLNGTNHKIATDGDSNLKALMAPIDNVMYLGADVTHPSPDQKKIPSVVGVAASHDKYGACYNCQYRLQEPTKECIDDMESIVLKHLEIYNRYQKKYPSKIIYYRDGVSDGQFPHIKNVEIRCIQNACKKMGCNPKLTCVIVVKRHHTRFFPLTQPSHDRDFNNVQPGSVVDQHITHPNEVQFFMVSHQSIQGTAKPTRYNVIMDESKFDINLLQKLTYNLCHLFPRCNRVVSYPAPAYLAHLVAFRGRVYIEGRELDNRNYKREYERRLIKPEFMIRNPMYFI